MKIVLLFFMCHIYESSCFPLEENISGETEIIDGDHSNCNTDDLRLDSLKFKFNCGLKKINTESKRLECWSQCSSNEIKIGFKCDCNTSIGQLTFVRPSACKWIRSEPMACEETENETAPETSTGASTETGTVTETNNETEKMTANEEDEDHKMLLDFWGH